MSSNEVASRTYGPRVYLDQDGVLADFSKGLESYGVKQDLVTYGTPDKDKTPEQWAIDKAVRDCMKAPGFFENLPMMEGADELWKVAGPYCSILTALPNNGADERVKLEKRNWIDRVFGQIPDDRFIACLRSEKVKYATHHYGPMVTHLMKKSQNILVDDLEINCKMWERAGGKAIFFTSMEQAINDLKKVLNV